MLNHSAPALHRSAYGRLSSLHRLLRRCATDVSTSAAQRPALVVAPHPDDETLGCGGTIALKRARETPVTVVALSDGRDSHTDPAWPAERLAAARREEFVRACTRLGVERDRVILLDHGGGIDARTAPEIAARLSSIVRETGPAEVYVPCRLESHREHAAAWRITNDVLRAFPEIETFEYFIWFWYPRWWRALGRTLLAPREGSRPRLVRVALGAQQLESKGSALEAHQTQMTVPPDSVGPWPVLGEIEDGAFLARCLQGAELFLATRAGS
ncbi:MAG: PIG-L deacetylase family protein [Pseudomonadales bacterium]|jgi:LmbE family N-acetylglucosaminyl deacetylase|nr:PIG-L deacetylase family protein [Pseudomonadales bacterium]